MKRYKPFLLGMLAGVALTFSALRYHVVRHDDGISMVPRNPQPPLRSVYSDVRDWGGSMWEQHPEVAQALIANGQTDVIADELVGEVSQQVHESYRLNSEKLQSLLTEYQTDRARAAVAEAETTSVSHEGHANNGGMNIGRFPQGMFQNPGQGGQVPVIEQSAPPAQSTQPPAPSQWHNPFNFQRPRGASPTVGSGSSIPSSSDAVAVRSNDPWLRNAGQVAHLEAGEDADFISSIPASFDAQADESANVEGWLPGLLSSLISTEGEPMHGQAQPKTLDIGLEAERQPAQQAIAPEASREPIIQVRPF